MDCDIVLLPDEDTAQLALTTSQDLRRSDTVFTLEAGKYYPHFSLYMVRLRIKDIEKVYEQLRQIAVAYQPLQLHATYYEQERGYLVVNYAVSPQLHSLQLAVLTAVNPMRDGIIEKDREHILEAVGLAKSNYDMYGYKYVGELFKPHITLTRFENEVPADESVLPEPSLFSGRFAKIALCELGISNTCVRLLAVSSLIG